MKVNELRLGNNILIKTSNDNWINTKVDLTVLCFLYEFAEDWKGIPLTEEMLLTFGFEIKPFSIGLTFDRFRFIWKEEYKYWYVVDTWSHSYLTKIEFAHELQNFILVMNGQELDTAGLI